jgi:hypothetical protein
MERHPAEREPGLVLACPAILRQSNMAAVAQEGLEIWDAPYLRAMAGQLEIVGVQLLWSNVVAQAPSAYFPCLVPG